MTAKHPTKRRYVHFFQSVKTTYRSSPTHAELEASLLSYRHILKTFPLAAQPLLKGLLLLPHFCLSPLSSFTAHSPGRPCLTPLSSSQLFCPSASLLFLVSSRLSCWRVGALFTLTLVWSLRLSLTLEKYLLTD